MQIELMPDYSLLAIMAIFIVNYLIVRKFFLQPINAILESREQETRSADELYSAALARFTEATTQMETQLHAARRAAAEVRERHRAEAAAHRQQLVDSTGAASRQLIAEADQRLSRDVEEARESIARDADELARVAAERILGRAV